jgi:hypothetical protein
VRPRLAWLSGLLGGLALVRLLGRRRETVHSAGPAVFEPLPSPPVAEDDEPDHRADELRRKLAESRALEDERERFESGETPVDEAEPAADPVDRRRQVHEEGRAAAERMRGSRDDAP